MHLPWIQSILQIEKSIQQTRAKVEIEFFLTNKQYKTALENLLIEKSPLTPKFINKSNPTTTTSIGG